MLKSTGLVLAASGIVVANDVIVPAMTGGKASITNLNWRIVPATAVLALTLGGLEKVSEPLGVGLAGLVLLAVLVIPVGGSKTTPLDSMSQILGNYNAGSKGTNAATATAATRPNP